MTIEITRKYRPKLTVWISAILSTLISGVATRAWPSTEMEPPAASSVTLSYEQALGIGMQYNLDLLAAKYNIPLAQADELTSGLWNNPSLLVDTALQPFTRNWDQTNAGGPRQYDIGFAYPLDLSGKISSGRKSAHKTTEVAKTLFQDAMRQKLRDIRLAYIDVMTLQQQLSLAAEKKNSFQDLLRVIEARVGVGGRLPLLKLRARLARDQAVLDERQKEIALRAAQASLAVILGSPSDAQFRISTGLREFQMSETSPVKELIAAALANRPDLVALHLALEKTELDRRLAVAQRWDNFILTAGFSTQGPVAANPNDPTTAEIPRGNSWNAGLAIPLPLFNRNQGNILKTSWAAGQLRKQIASLELSIAQEIEAIDREMALNRRLILDFENQQLANARKVRDEQQRLVGMGSNSLLDYFDAVGAYVSVVSAYYEAVGEYRREAARLSAACAKEVMP
jgi:cobalt-zinc-cadmium efflux system outer membrane protein